MSRRSSARRPARSSSSHALLAQLARTSPRSSARAPSSRRLLDRLLAQRAHVGEAHAVGREHAGERMDEHARHAERVGDEARVLPARAAEAAQRVFGDVVAALHRDVLDRVGHVVDRDAQEALGDLLGRCALAGRAAISPRAPRTSRARPRRRAARRRAGRTPAGRTPAGSCRPSRCSRSRSAGRRGGSTPGPGSRPPNRGRRESARRRSADRAAAGGDGVDRHHRRAHAHAGDPVSNARSNSPA